MITILQNIKNLDDVQYKNLRRAVARLGYYIESDEKNEKYMSKINCPNCQGIKKIVSKYGYNIECQ